jgi:hypothetical protein
MLGWRARCLPEEAISPRGSMGSPRGWFRLPFVYRPRAERRESPALAAFHWDGSTPRPNRVANISSSGAYLLTSERWKAGEIVSLTLQRSGALETAGPRHFTVQAKAIRRDRDGVGVAFLMPRGADLRLWQSAIEIALHADELLALERDGARLQADPAVVLRILEDGSWAEADWIQHYWAGILATSCVSDESVQSSIKFVSLLSQLTTIQARIFAGSCQLSAKSIDENGCVSIRPLTCSSGKLVQIADTHDRVHIERDIQHLIELGLIEKRSQWKFFSLLDQAVITPTATSLELYARCHGHRGAAEEFFADCPAAESIAGD